MRAVLYCRVSTVEQTQNLSLPTQEKACREYAAREGYEVADVFVDRGESAKTTNRPEFRRLLAHCRAHAGKVHAVIVYGLSRFSRNSTDHHAIAALLRGYGIALRSVTEPIDDSPAGRFMEGICAAMAQFDNDLRSARTKVGMKAAADQGRWVWQAPVGYRTGARAQREPSLVPHPEHADLLRRAFHDIADSDRAIIDVCAELQASGLRGRQGQPLPVTTVHRLLRNPAYTGRLVSLGLGLDRSGDWTPLVSEDVWQRVQVRLAQTDTPARTTRHPDFPLRRFVHCSACGRPMTGGWSAGRSQRYAYYHCQRHCLSITKGALEDAFLALLEAMRPTAAFLALVRRDVLLAWQSEADRAQAQRTQLEGQIGRLRAQLRRLDEAYVHEQVIDAASYTARRDETRERLALAEIALSAAVVDALDIDGALGWAEQAMVHGAALWRSAQTTERRQRLQWLLFPDGVAWTGTEVLNRGSRWTCYQLAESEEGGSHLASPMSPILNQIAAWADGWRAFLAA